MRRLTLAVLLSVGLLSVAGASQEAAPSIRLNQVPDKLTLPLPAGTNQILTATKDRE